MVIIGSILYQAQEAHSYGNLGWGAAVCFVWSVEYMVHAEVDYDVSRKRVSNRMMGMVSL